MVSDIDMATKEEATEMREEKVRIHGSSTVESSAFAYDVGTHGGMKMIVIATLVFHGNTPPLISQR